MSETGVRIFRICAISSWIFGIFPTYSPCATGFHYIFTPRRSGVIYSACIGIVHIAALTHLLVTTKGPSHSHPNNDSAYFYEDFLTKIMIAVLLVTNICTRLTGLFRCKTICRLVESIAELKAQLSEHWSESETNPRRVYAFYMLSVLALWTRTVGHLFLDLTSDRELQKQSFMYMKTESFEWVFILVHAISFIGYATASYFAYTLTYVIGTELSLLYSGLCKDMEGIRGDGVEERNGVAKNHHSLSRYVDHDQLSKDAADGVADNFQDGRIILEGTRKSIGDLRQNFKDLFDHFQTYRNVCGILCVTLLAESTYCFFYCLSDIISMGANRRECSDVGAFVNLLIFLSLVDLGNMIEIKIRNQSAVIKYAHACDADNDRSYNKDEWKAQLVALETWVMDWSWRFNAMDLFTMNRSLITGVLGVITSYVMIVFQMKMSGSSSAHDEHSAHVGNTTY